MSPDGTDCSPPLDLGSDGVRAFRKLCSIGCDYDALVGLLQWLAADVVEIQRNPARSLPLPEALRELLSRERPESTSTPDTDSPQDPPEKLRLHAADFTDKKMLKELEKYAEMARQAQALCDAIPDVKRMPVVRFLHERRMFPPGDFLRGPSPALAVTLNVLRQRLQGLADLPRMVKDTTGPQKYPDRKELLLALARHVHDRVTEQRAQHVQTMRTSDPWREVAKLLAPILIDILPPNSGLNKSGKPLTEAGLFKWCKRHAELPTPSDS